MPPPMDSGERTDRNIARQAELDAKRLQGKDRVAVIYPTRETYKNIPELMRHPNLNRWVCFQCILQPDGKVTKFPVTILGKPASIDDSQTWSSFDKCLDAVGFCIGNSIGFAVGIDYKLAVIDLDNCFLPDGNLTPTARKYIKTLEADAYIERSISGRGVHIFIWYNGPAPPTHPEPGVEIYTDKRFIVMTGVSL